MAAADELLGRFNNIDTEVVN